jgi:tetratricopeptide (TPR) repeat protein
MTIAPRMPALVALASLGGSETTALFESALSDEDPDIVALALRSLGRSGNASAAPQVLGVLRGPLAAQHIDGLLAYYEAVPQAMTETVSLAFVSLLGGQKLKTSSRVRILDALREMTVDASNSFKKELVALTLSGSRQVSDAALTLLAAIGDKNARRTLLKPYNDQVDKNKTWQDAFLQRGDVLYKIRDYRDAIEDYKDAIRIGSRNAGAPAPYIGIARCYARLGRFKDAAKYLDDAAVSFVTLRELADHPDFREMRAHKKWVKSFHLEQE